MSEGLNGAWGEEIMEAAAGKEALEANLVPKGKWPGQLVADDEGNPARRKIVSTEGGSHPMEGKTTYGCHVLLETDEGPRHLFFDACPETIKVTKDDGGSYMRQESTNAAMLYNATKLFGTPFVKVLETAKQRSLVYEVGIRKATDEYPAKNTIRSITMPEAGA